MNDLMITGFSMESCTGSKGKTQARPAFHILHFVFRGSGFFNGERIAAGQMFFLPADHWGIWEPDPADPWEYGFVNGSGGEFDRLLAAMGLDKSSSKPIRYQEQVETLIRIGQCADDPDFHAGLFAAICRLQLISSGANQQYAPQTHLRNAVRLIEARSGCITVAETAEQLHLSPGYLRALFFEKYHQSAQAFIMTCRMNRAALMLAQSAMTVAEIAASVGYRDPLQFSKAFKKFMGQSPRAYRKQLAENDSGNGGT